MLPGGSLEIKKFMGRDHSSLEPIRQCYAKGCTTCTVLRLGGLFDVKSNHIEEVHL